MQYLNRLFVVLVLIAVLLVGSVASAQGETDAGPDTGEGPPVIVVDTDGDEQTLWFTALIGLGMFAVVMITAIFGQRGLDVALQTGGLIVGKTRTPLDDQWLIEIAVLNGYNYTKMPDGSIKFERGADVPHEPRGA